MNKTNVSKFFKNVGSALSAHSPEILTGIGIAGMITTTILAVKATPKALKLLEEKKHKEGTDDLTALETVKTTWKCYIPATVTGVTSVACLIGASRVSLRRNAALATAYKLSETALTEYKEKVVETIGEKKARVIEEKIDKDRVDKNPVSKSEVVVTKKGDTLCMDYYSGRYFTSDIDQINKALNQANGMLLREDYISLNDIYAELGLDPTGTGDILGWTIDKVGHDLISLRTSAQIADDGRPCIVVSYEPTPEHDYSKFL